MNTHFFGDTAVLTGRSLRHITRSLDTIITTTIMPIAFMLLFVFVFGGAINSGSDSYVNYLLPGILLITVASGVSYTAFRLFLDMKSGIFDAIPLHADRAVVRAVGARADLAGRHPDVARGRRARRPPHGLPLGGGRAGVARGRRHPGPVHPGADVARRDSRSLREDRRRRGRVLLPAHLPAVHQLGIRAHRAPCPARCAPSPRTSR